MIHDDIGAGGWMSDPNQAARDPIFYMHHCNIDRLWKRWLALGGGRVNPTGNTTWINQTFRFFDHDANAVVNVPVRNFLDTVTQLQYRYEDDPVAPAMVAAAPGRKAGGAMMPTAAARPPQPSESAAAAASPETLAASPQGIRLGQERVSVPLAAASPRMPSSCEASPRRRARPMSAGAQTAATGSQRIILRLSGIDFDRNPGTPYQVYLNLPEGEEADPHSIYFAGVLGFFGLSAAQHDAGHGQAGQDAGGVRLFDITDLVARQSAAGVWKGDQPTVTLVVSGVPVAGGKPKTNPQANARIGKVEILRQ